MPSVNQPLIEIDQVLAMGLPGDDPRVLDALEVAADLVRKGLQSGSASAADTVTRIVAALRHLEGTESAELRINALIDAAQYFYVIGQPFSSIEPAREAVKIAKSADLKSLHRKALTVFGITSADTGNISQAIEAYADAIELAEALGDRDAKCVVWVNLGVAMLNCAQYRDAIMCFETAIELAEGHEHLLGYRLTALSNIALCSLHLEDFARGLKAAEITVRDSSEPKTAAEMLARVLRENNYVRLLLEVNNIDRARERCVIARKYASASHSARAEIAAAIAEGLCEVQSGRADVGLSRLTSTLEKARVLRSMLRDTLAALVKAHEIVGQPQRALMYLREMMESTRQTQQENALKHLQLHMEHLGLEGSSQVGFQPSLERREAALKGQVAEQELFKSRIEMLERLAVTAELRDDSTGEHSYRVGKLSALLAAEYGCDDGTCFMVELAARLHDIGKIGVPDAILLKPDKLNDAERSVMRSHTTVGAELLSKSNIPHMQMAEEIARHHHEWWDGSGYPGNLSGTGIPVSSRITALADVFDALTHKRPYKEAWPLDRALDEIASLQGKQFDPQLTGMFLELIGRLRSEHGDLDAFLGQAAHASPFLQARSKIWETLRRSKDNDGSGSDSRLDLQR
ncbi:MAG: HD domain-containing phosphohydrolase [Burkholderiales bacterium]